MKKITRKALAILFAMTLCVGLFALAACDTNTTENNNNNSSNNSNNNSKPETLEGKYVLCEATDDDGEPMDMESLQETLEEEGLSLEESFFFEFFDDQTYLMVFDDVISERDDGSYVKKGNTLTVATEDDETEMVLSENETKLTWDHPDGLLMVFEK